MPEFIISQKLAQEVIDYLASKPYAEVYRLIGALQTMKPVKEQETPKKK